LLLSSLSEGRITAAEADKPADENIASRRT